MPSDPLPRRTSRRRRGAPTAPAPMDWGAWLEGARPGEEATAAFPGQRPGSDPVVDLRQVPDGTLAAGLAGAPGYPYGDVDLTAAERPDRRVPAGPSAGPAAERAAGRNAAAQPEGERPLTRRERRRLEQGDQADPSSAPTSASPSAPSSAPSSVREATAAAGFPGRGRGSDRPDGGWSGGEPGDRPDPAERAELPDARPAATGRRRGRWLLPLLAGLLLVVSATCLLDTSVSFLVALATFGPAVTLAAVPVVAFAVRGRRWVTVGVASVAALLPWVLVGGYAMPGPSPTVPAGHKIRVMTVNAQYGQADPAQIVSAVQKMGVDILVVTELTHQLAHDLTPAGLPGLLTARFVDVDAPGAGGIGVWSRYEAAAVTPIEGTRWPAAKLTLTTPGGPLEVVAAHVSPPIPGPTAAPWRTDLRLLTDAAGSGDAARLVVGDLNATPWHAPFRRLTGDGLRDAADVLGHGLRNTWPAWTPTPLTALDHVLLGGPVDVSEVDTVQIDGTDHRALVVRVAIPGADGD